MVLAVRFIVRFMLDNLYNLLYSIRYTKLGVFMGKVYNLLTRERVIVVSRYNVLFELNNRIPAKSNTIKYIRTKGNKDTLIVT